MIWKEVTEKEARVFQSILTDKNLLQRTFSEREKEIWQTYFDFSLEELHKTWTNEHQVPKNNPEQYDLFGNLEPKESREIQLKPLENPTQYTFTYSYLETNLGVFIAVHSQVGLHYFHFVNEEESALRNVQDFYGKYDIQKGEMSPELKSKLFSHKGLKLLPLGTDFQLRVWQKLTSIPSGEKRSYKQLALELGDKKAVRAVGTAIGANPIAYLIPCHRVIQSSGKLAGFRWGLERKNALLNLERLSLHTASHVI